MRIKRFDYVATGTEINLTNDEVTILRGIIQEHTDSIKDGIMTSNPLEYVFCKKLLKRLPVT